ncbi:hypothetical protein [Haloimpatiens lingqiaonensis]|uniref:hypothetical protein n=1 Tax=Haloimpatiens lingqiaonensis TaxID=1380675 RepID=UPI0010FDDC2F|nr:hypothetical protein [Haloimpatiens lingqiaonensis]
MKNKKNKTPYGPNKRDYLEQEPKKVTSCSEKDCIELPDNVTDSIIVNNISYPEFDYTYNDGEDI